MTVKTPDSKGGVAEYAIVTKDLVKKFGDFTAVNGLNLKIKTGELFGFLGPNGAGKTTTIRILTTLTSPTDGSAKVAGFDLIDEPAFVRDRIGVVPQSFALFEELTPMENLWFIGELYGMSKSLVVERGNELLRTVELFDKKDVICSGFSGGMKQRLSVAAGLLHEPQILFMDEPTTGLDPQSRIALRELTKRLNDSGITIVYTTHDMEEADKLCDRIAIMDRGRVIAEGTPSDLKSKHGSGHSLKLDLGRVDDDIIRGLKEVTGSSRIDRNGSVLDIHTEGHGGAFIYKVSKFLSDRKADVRELSVREPTLEEVFINLTKKDLRD